MTENIENELPFVKEEDPEEEVYIQSEEPDILDLNLSDEELQAQAEERKRRQQQTRSREFWKEVFSWVIPLVLAAAIALFLKSYVIINANIPTGSMENTIMAGDNVIGYRLAYRTEDPKRGDVVIFYNPDNEDEKFVKRIIGMPGEHVRIDGGHVYIDGEVIQEDYLPEEWTEYLGPYEFDVPEDSYLMLGDNRNNSLDARLWINSYVSRDKIIAKAIAVYWPLSDAGSLTDTPDFGLPEDK